MSNQQRKQASLVGAIGIMYVLTIGVQNTF